MRARRALPATLIAALALSSSTYSRAKREALERMAALLPIVLRELPPPAPPASLIAPPPPMIRSRGGIGSTRAAWMFAGKSFCACRTDRYKA